jgi:predicted GNAT superfamily acetyltransferase
MPGRGSGTRHGPAPGTRTLHLAPLHPHPAPWHLARGTCMNLRDLTTIEDCRRVVELEKQVWGYRDGEDVVPVPVLIVTVKRGGILIGAFDPPERLIGFVYSFPALRNGRVTQWSHMLGVRASHRSAGVGFRLKVEQRHRARQMGLDLIEWTFDPLQAVNAHLNFRRLGALAGEYVENLYGSSSSSLHQGTPTDRLIVEWPITARRVEDRLQGSMPQVRSSTSVTPTVNRTRPLGGWLTCDAVDLSVSGPQLSMTIPTGFTRMQAEAPELARSWRQATRDLFLAYLGRGYRVVDFVVAPERTRGSYLLAGSDAEGNPEQGTRNDCRL